MPASRSAAKSVSGTKPKRSAAKLAAARKAAVEDRAKHERAAQMISELRSGAEALVASADRLLARLS